jgi:hypothetical protein
VAGVPVSRPIRCPFVGPARGSPAESEEPTALVPDRWVDAALIAWTVVGLGLRLLLLGRPATLNPDETYSAYTASLPLGEIVPFVRATDPHPPLSYLLQAPVARLTDAEWALRLPSALCSAAAVALLAWWQRRRGLEGVVATALLALLPLALTYGVQVRMYGLLQLAGVATAFGVARWCEAPSGRWLWLAVGGALVAAFSHATGLLLLAGLLVVPGWRRPRGPALAWWAAVAGALGLWALAWGSATLGWRSESLYPPVTPETASIAINESIAPAPGNRPVALAVLLAGAVAVVWRRDVTARALVAAYLVPLAGAVVLGLRIGLIPKTLVALEWGVAVSLAGLTGVAYRWRPQAGVLAVAVVALLVLPAVPYALEPQGHEAIVARLSEVAESGDVIASHPHDNVLRWYVYRDPERRLRPAPELPWPVTTAAKVGDTPFSGRVWFVESTFLGDPLGVEGPGCAPPEVLPERRVLRCLIAGPRSP